MSVTNSENGGLLSPFSHQQHKTMESLEEEEEKEVEEEEEEEGEEREEKQEEEEEDSIAVSAHISSVHTELDGFSSRFPASRNLMREKGSTPG